MFKTNKLTKSTFLSAAIILVATQGWAAGLHIDGHDAKPNIGIPGKTSDASRTIEIKMFDNYYEPENISVSEGETILFVVKNAGELVHEFNIATSAMHAAHQEEMMKMMEHGALESDKINHEMMKMDMGGGKTMEHSDPNSILLEPGKSGEVVWKFIKASALEFACNIPGHYEAGMMGEINFQPRH
jgi:uncharacterized cupredoxin-like copper-binding protein